MEGDDDDLDMLDVPESTTARNVIASSRNEFRSAPRSIHPSLSSISNRPVIANGFREFLTESAPISDDEVAIAPSRLLKDPSRESSVLAREVTNQLNTEPFAEAPPEAERLDQFIDDLEIDEQEPPAAYASTRPTGYCYDVRMRYHCELEPPKDRRDYHPEDPRRIFAIYRELCVAGLVRDKILNTGAPLVPVPLKRIDVREVSEAEVTLVHDKRHFELMKSTSEMSTDDLISLGAQCDSIYLNAVTFDCAKLSAGGAIETCRAVAEGMVKNAIAIVRPPGHHAECSRPMGFCIFDNVSIAAKVCQADYPESCRKVLILDWDVHHGNGIQQAFYQDPNVLYISLHVHENGNFYPNGPYGDHLHCGAGPGLGKNINIPWPTKSMGDAEYMLAFQQIVMPVAYEFNPDFVIIAAGFDAAEGDQLGGCFVTPSCYAHMTHMLMSLAHGKVVACLEGGYNLRSISKSALAVTRTLIGEMPEPLDLRKATTTGIETIQKVAMFQSKHWPCLFPKDADQGMNKKVGAERLHDVIRLYQASQMKDSHNMINVKIYQEKLSKSFENQIMATPNFEQAVPLIVFFHDPPEIMGIPHPLTKSLELHNTWLADGLKHYVDWAAKKGFAVIDTNIPKYLTDLDDDHNFTEEVTETRMAAADQLAAYLWDNYIDCNDAPTIIFFGVGTAYQAIVHLMNTRESFHTRVAGMINFIADSPGSALIAASDQTVYHLSKWYRANSVNYVSKAHAVWSPERQRKPSKRYGNLIESSEVGISEMLMEHQAEIEGWISRRV